MRTRLEFHKFLEELIGNKNVYYQPPASVKMKYPAIVYGRSSFDNRYANDKVYKQKTRYSVTIIDKKPDNPAIEELSKLPYCLFDRHYTADGLNHDVFTIYF